MLYLVEVWKGHRGAVRRCFLLSVIHTESKMSSQQALRMLYTGSK